MERFSHRQKGHLEDNLKQSQYILGSPPQINVEIDFSFSSYFCPVPANGHELILRPVSAHHQRSVWTGVAWI